MPPLFKSVTQFEAVSHRMGGLHAKNDPLENEKIGGRKRVADDSLYREPSESKAARLAAREQEKKAKKEEKKKDKKDKTPSALEAFKAKMKSSASAQAMAQAVRESEQKKLKIQQDKDAEAAAVTAKSSA